ncbi:MAG: hypothetical protein QMB52_12970 [Propionivibrio sp.]
MKTRFFLSLAVLAFSIAACTTVDSVKQSGEIVSRPGVDVTPEIAVSAETQAVAAGLLIWGHPVSAFGLPGEVFNPQNSALLYIIYDPLAPNWTIKEQALNAEMYHLSLRAKHFRVGGDGEAIQILKRRALQLQREKGFSGYRLLDYSEGVESSTPFTYRVSEGTVQLVNGR